MTVSSTDSEFSYAGNGSTTAFAFSNVLYEDTSIEVILTDSSGVDTVQTLTTHYTVAIAGDSSSATVNMVTAPASGETLTLKRAEPLTQLTDYIEGGPFPAGTHEQALDRLVLISQMHEGRLDRALIVSPADGGAADYTVPTPEAEKILGWNAAANALINVDKGDAGVVTPGTDTVDTDAIQDDAVTTAKIDDDAVTTAKIADEAVTNAKLADMAQATVKGRASGAGTGAPVDLTATQLRAIIPSYDLLATYSLSSVASLDMTSVITDDYSMYVVIGSLVPATDGANLHLRTSTDNGSSFNSGGSDYQQQNLDAGVATVSAGESTGGQVILSLSTGSAAGEYLSLQMTVAEPTNSSLQTIVSASVAPINATFGDMRIRQVSGRRVTAEDNDAIQLLFSSGNIESGEVRIYGVK